MRRYSRRYGRKRPTLRRQVKRAVASLSETKVAYHKQIKEVDLNELNGSVQLRTFNAFGPLSTGTNALQRIGNKIHLSGIRVALTFDNSSDNAGIPCYITTAVLMTNDVTEITLSNLFKGYSSGLSGLDVTGPANGKEHWKDYIHTTPLNTTTYRVLHRSSIRLGCKAQPDLPGPRYAQRLMYLPINKTITFPQPTVTETTFPTIKPRIVVLHMISNPTQIDQSGAATLFLGMETTCYFKDL